MEKAKDFTHEERIDGFNRNMARDGQLSHDMEELGRGLVDGGDGVNGEGKGRKWKWLIPNGKGYEAGDVMFHNQWMIHGAAKNEDPEGVIRLSSDVRFYEEGADYDKRWMRFWEPNDGL